MFGLFSACAPCVATSAKSIAVVKGFIPVPHETDLAQACALGGRPVEVGKICPHKEIFLVTARRRGFIRRGGADLSRVAPLLT